MKFMVAVKGVIEKDGKILVIKRASSDDHRPDVWETVGGRMESEISPEDELKREIKEETGLIVQVNDPFNVFSFIRDTGEFVVGISFKCKYLGGEVKLSDEHSEYAWIRPEDFIKYNSTESLYKEIKKYEKIKQ